MNSKIVLLLVTASGDDHQMNASAVACCMLLKCKGITWLSSCFHLTVKTQKGRNNDVVFSLPKTRCEVQIKYACHTVFSMCCNNDEPLHLAKIIG